jgi:hypothetical protein
VQWWRFSFQCNMMQLKIGHSLRYILLLRLFTHLPQGK